MAGLVNEQETISGGLFLILPAPFIEKRQRERERDV